MNWTPERTTHDQLCECGGEALIPYKARDQRGDHYIVWRQCKGTGPWLPDHGPQPTMSFAEYIERNPNWFNECATPDWRDHEFCRNTGRAIARDPGCVPFPFDNPLYPLVAKYAREYGWTQPGTEAA